jgi:hypothetical protein
VHWISFVCFWPKLHDYKTKNEHYQVFIRFVFLLVSLFFKFFK